MEEVIGSMAGQVPLRSIADVIMQRYGADRWGDFKVSAGVVVETLKWWGHSART